MSHWYSRSGRPTLGHRIHAGFVAAILLTGAALFALGAGSTWEQGGAPRGDLVFVAVFLLAMGVVALLVARGYTLLPRACRLWLIKNFGRGWI